MPKLKCSGEGTSLTNFQNVKNDPMGPSNLEFLDSFPNMAHNFSKFQDTKNSKCYHGAIFNPKSSQKVPKMAIFTCTMNEAFLGLILSNFYVKLIV